MGTLSDFESIKQINMLGQEYWSARDLMGALGYDNWQNFENANLSSTALQAGVLSKNMGLFHDAGYQGMYTMTSGELAAFWNVPAGVEILDVMGPEALGANLFRITQTDAKLKRDHVQDEDTAIVTHHDVGQEVRQAIENIHQKKPEDLPRASSIRKLVEEKRRKARKKLKNPSTDEQETLF